MSKQRPVIWIIDPEQWPRAMLRAELIERGYDAVGYLNIDHASRSIGSRPPHLIIVDLHGLSRGDVAPLFAAGVPVIAVAGAENDPWARELPFTAVLRRPVSIGEISDRVAELVSS